MRSRSILSGLAGAALLASACGGPREPVVGAVLPASGSTAAYGALVRQGMDLAVGEINAAGGIDGQPFKILYEDSGGDSARAVEAGRRLLEEHGVPAIIGEVSSTVTSDLLKQVTSPASIILLSPASSSPALTGASPYFMRVYPSDALEGSRIAEVAAGDLKLKRLVVFAADDEYGAGYKRVLIDRFQRRRNREVVRAFDFKPGTTDFSPMIAEAVALAPDGYMLIGYESEVAALSRAIRTAAAGAPILCSGSVTSAFFGLAGEAGEGVIFARPDYRMTGNQEQVAKFIDTYRARHGSEPEAYAAYGYDAVMVLARAMQAGNRDARDILIYFRSPASEYVGVTGTILFGNEGDVVAVPTPFIVHQGQFVSLKRYQEQGGALPGAGAGPGDED